MASRASGQQSMRATPAPDAAGEGHVPGSFLTATRPWEADGGAPRGPC